MRSTIPALERRSPVARGLVVGLLTFASLTLPLNAADRPPMRPTLVPVSPGETAAPLLEAAGRDQTNAIDAAFEAPAVKTDKIHTENFKRPKTDNAFKDATLARGGKNILAAWFSGPTKRYGHAPFGGDTHPEVLTVSLADHRVLRFKMPADSVFEDREPRIADIDGDGQDDIVVVRGYLKRGAALAVISVRDNTLAIIAETPPIGVPMRWLNPAGIADFDGDGKLDIALVVTPHIGGELQFWTFRDNALEQIADDIGDVTNHVLGSRHLGLSAVADFNRDGIADLALASQDRRHLRFFTIAGGSLRELGIATLPGPVAENFSVAVVGGHPAVRVGIAGGRTHTVVPCRDISDWRMLKGSCP